MENEDFTTLIERTVQDLLETRSSDEVSPLMQYMFHQRNFMKAIEESRESEEKRKEVALQFRKHFAPMYKKWGFLNHAYTKPYGYSGDYKVFEYLYDSRHHEDTHKDFVHLDHYIFSLSLYQSIVERKNILVYLLKNYLKRNPSLSICSIACGGARELRELDTRLNKSQVTLVDFDSRALEYAQTLVKPLTQDCESICLNATQWDLGDQLFDVIYCFGLFDYLSKSMVYRIMRRSLKNLSADGKYIFAIKDSTKYDTDFFYFLGDVEFVQRSVQDGYDMAAKHNLSVDIVIPSESHAINVFVCSRA